MYLIKTGREQRKLIAHNFLNVECGDKGKDRPVVNRMIQGELETEINEEEQ